MSTCRCGLIVHSRSSRDIERLYRAVADGEPRREVLQLIYDMFGSSCQLRPPVDEMRLADRCQPERRAHG